MNKEKELQLIETDPTFFEECYTDPQKSCMAFGVECDDGWFIPLQQLVQKTKLLNKLCKERGLKIVAKQIKEKFGGLRVYWNIENDNDFIDDRDFYYSISGLMDDTVSSAEEKCWNTCETCGAENGGNNPIVSTNGWIKRICQNCSQKKIDERCGDDISFFREGYNFLSPYDSEKIYFPDGTSCCFWGAFYFLLTGEDPKVLNSVCNPLLARQLCDEMLEGSFLNESRVFSAMKKTLMMKFTVEPNKAFLINTGSRKLIYKNVDHENFWGICTCENCEEKEKGNFFGKLLMEVREEIKNETEKT